MTKHLSLPFLLLLLLGSPAYLQAQKDDQVSPAVEEEDTQQKQTLHPSRNNKQKHFAFAALAIGGGILVLVYMIVKKDEDKQISITPQDSVQLPVTSPLKPTLKIEGMSPGQQEVLTTLQTQLKRQGTRALVRKQAIPEKIVSLWKKVRQALNPDRHYNDEEKTTPGASHHSSNGEEARFLRRFSERLEIQVLHPPSELLQTKTARGGTAGSRESNTELLTQGEQMELITIMVMLQADGDIKTIDAITVASVIKSLYPGKDIPDNIKNLTTNMYYWQQG